MINAEMDFISFSVVFTIGLMGTAAIVAFIWSYIDIYKLEKKETSFLHHRRDL